MSSKILINVRPNQTRVASIDNDKLIDFQIDKKVNPTHVGSIYKGKVKRVLPGMQSAFVEIGLEKAAFLYVADVYVEGQSHHYAMPPEPNNDQEEEGPLLKEAWTEELQKMRIQDLLVEGQEILCQVAKDPIGTKGARITMQISLPGRSLVFMPLVDHLGVSKKIQNEEERIRLKAILEDIAPKGGVIVRTAGEGKEASDFKSDLDYFYRLWKEIKRNFEKRKTAGLVNKDLDIELRALRDMLHEEIQEIIIDDERGRKKILNFLSQFMPRYKNKVKIYSQDKPIYDLYNIELDVSRALGRKIWLKSGGYLVFDEAEALVVVDVNTGRFVGKKDVDDTILQTNLEAAKEIAHQLRIRNCGGIIIIDFIDMSKENHKNQVLSLLQEDLSLDRARTTLTSISELGLVEMTRKRTRPSLISTLCEPCEYCDGRGYVKKAMTVANEIFRALERQKNDIDETKLAVVRCHSAVADWVYADESESLDYLEQVLGCSVVFKVESHFHTEEFDIELRDRY